MSQVSLLIITMKVLVEEITADSLNNTPAKHHASSLTAKNWLALLVFGAIVLVIAIMVREAEAGEKRATHLQGSIAARQDHLSLNDANFRMVHQVAAQDRNKLAICD